MLFSSNTFLFGFLPAVVVLYYLCPRRCRNVLLLVSSLIFYGWGEPKYVLLMLVSILLNYFCGLAAARQQSRQRSTRGVLVLGVVLNLGMLGFFKYGKFFFGSAFPDIPLPIGISFYIFQAMSYLIDVCRREVEVQKNVLTFGTYVTLFPQLIAGPIVRYRDVAEMLESRRENLPQFSRGVQRFVVGLSKKVLLANTFGSAWNALQVTTGTAAAWLGLLCYTLQIYFDFSGYSDMAVGMGLMFGFHFPENFDHPYRSKSITEFWRRWHITLSSWFRDYVYIPLGGNRRGLAIQLRNIAIVWALTGIWHGASWNFLLWGVYFGILLMLEKLFLLRWLERLPAVLRHGYALFLILIGWVLFAFDDLSAGIAYLGALFGAGGSLLSNDTIYLFYTNLILLVILCIASAGVPQRLRNLYGRLAVKQPLAASLLSSVGAAAVLLLSTAYLVDASYNPFLYFRF